MRRSTSFGICDVFPALRGSARMRLRGMGRQVPRRRGGNSALFKAVCLAGLLTLASCSGGPRRYSRADYDGALQCAPYARAQTGVALRGRAASWWAQARGRYARSKRPRANAILVFRATSRIPSGHVSVVRKVVSARRIIVEHANWEAGRIDRNAPVIDVSRRNDWSLVRVFWAPSGRIGSGRYPTYGFILTGK